MTFSREFWISLGEWWDQNYCQGALDGHLHDN